jgi:hypothetical protein
VLLDGGLEFAQDPIPLGLSAILYPFAKLLDPICQATISHKNTGRLVVAAGFQMTKI